MSNAFQHVTDLSLIGKEVMPCQFHLHLFDEIRLIFHKLRCFEQAEQGERLFRLDHDLTVADYQLPTDVGSAGKETSTRTE